MFSDLVSQPFIKLEVFTARRESSEVNHKGKGGSVQQHGEGLQGHRTETGVSGNSHSSRCCDGQSQDQSTAFVNKSPLMKL